MKNPIKIDFDKSGYQNEINRLYEFGKTLTNVQSIIQELTKNNISDFDLESINQWAKEHYNFINVKAIYQLNNLDVKYNYVKDFLLNNSTEKLKLFNINSKGIYEPCKELLEDTELRFTTYVKPELVGQYRNLVKLDSILKSVDKTLLRRLLVNNRTDIFIDLKRFKMIQNSFSNRHRI